MNLHSKIMNIQVGTVVSDEFPHKLHAYKCGHRDARHAAAEIAIKSDELIQKLFNALENRHADDLVDELKEEYNLV